MWRLARSQPCLLLERSEGLILGHGHPSACPQDTVRSRLARNQPCGVRAVGEVVGLRAPALPELCRELRGRRVGVQKFQLPAASCWFKWLHAAMTRLDVFVLLQFQLLLLELLPPPPPKILSSIKPAPRLQR